MSTHKDVFWLRNKNKKIQFMPSYLEAWCHYCLFDLNLYVPSTIFQLNRDGYFWVEPVLSWDKCVFLKDHNAVTPVRLEPAAPQSLVKHSTTELGAIMINKSMCLYEVQYGINPLLHKDEF